ncbi:baculoviral IAP repeat-containing protein 7-like [Biomphalaria glabrata]|uniref:Baculoviral IAP repeat-containing protein 7-like n=1 Tax=Biomphalaria glabrata TaxID=6526 RepID=A0A9W3ASI8_BIOGL|nr:baculoviral IAP repeat-containing protein 7-like [Biomphalaria glabrata]
MAIASVSSEIFRLGTFQGWPGADIHCKTVKPNAIDLSKAGFFYTGSSDEVQCFVCGLKVADWERHHDPFVVHATRNPQCPFVLGSGSGNIPVFVPAEAAYMKIKSVLREAGNMVAGSWQQNPNTSVMYDTLKSLYGQGLLNQEPSLASDTPTPSNRLPSSNSPRLARGEKQVNRMKTGSPVPKVSGAPRSSSRTVDSPPARRSSTSESAISESPSTRPNFQRAKSCAFDPRSSRNSETIANRQTSNPGIDYMEYQDSEEARLQTFKSWSGVRGASAREFAQAGFIFIGAPDRVQCAYCHGILRNWNDNDVPLEEHHKHFPQCQFVKEFMSAVTVSRPKHQKYKTEPSRLSSFSSWDMSRNPKPSDLAKAGFFYVGHGDSVKCFFCDGGLRNWEPNDDPWREHARWFPRCQYVKQSKGLAFIENVLKDVNLTDYQTASVDETELKNIVKASAQRDIDPREITARMDSPIVKAVLNMEIPKPRVKEAIKTRLAENGEDFTSAEALLEAIFSSSSGGPGDVSDSVSDSKNEQDRRHPSESESQDSLKLMEENRLLKEQRQCKICMDEEVCVVFLPCGHLVCCSTCAPALNLCPICRAKIRGTVRTYIS